MLVQAEISTVEAQIASHSDLTLSLGCVVGKFESSSISARKTLRLETATLRDWPAASGPNSDDSLLFPQKFLHLPSHPPTHPFNDMQSGHKVRQAEEKHIASLTSFASTLHRRVHSNLAAPDLPRELQHHIDKFPLSTSPALASKADIFDRHATELWNFSTRILRDEPTSRDESRRKLLCLIRVFAVLLLDSAQTSGRAVKTLDNVIRVLRVALKAAKFCLEQGHLDACTKALERAARWQDEFADQRQDLDSDVREIYDRLTAEYFVLRTAHAWKQSRLDLAEYFYSKSGLDSSHLSPETAEMLADVLFEIGKDMLQKQECEKAVIWLDRAYNAIGEQSIEELTNDASELRLAVLNYLIRAHLKRKRPDAREKASGLIDVLEMNQGDKMVVSLLRMDLLTSEENPDVVNYHEALDRMMSLVVLTEQNFRTIIHHIHRLMNWSPDLALKTLDDLLYSRLFEYQNKAWIEKAIVTRIWITVESNDQGSIEALLEIFDSVHQNMGEPFSAPATHASQTILWKRIEGNCKQDQYAKAERVARLAKHPIFAKSGEQNRAKIARKTIMCATARQDWAAAREIFFQMSEAGRKEPLTRFLMYKVALRDHDRAFAAECLDVVCSQSDTDATILYACVMDAQGADDKQSTILALQRILEKYDYQPPPGVHLPALLRCTARMLVNELEPPNTATDDAMGHLAKLFKGAATQADKHRLGEGGKRNPVFPHEELEWFSRNSYNICIKHLASMHPAQLLSILDSCIKFTSLLQTSGGSAGAASSSTPTDITLRLLIAHFIAGSSAVVLARSSDSTPNSINAYARVSQHSKAYRALLLASTPSADLGGSSLSDLFSKRAQLLRHEVEAALMSRNWDSLDALFTECLDHDAAQKTGAGGDQAWYAHHLATLADLALNAHAELCKHDNRNGDDGSSALPSTAQHRRRILDVLQRIINASWQVSHSGSGGGSCNKSQNDVAHLSRWLRCLFQLSLATPSLSSTSSTSSPSSSSSSSPDTIALSCVHQATAIASSSSASSSAAAAAAAYPQTELEWLATSSFNRAVDFYCADDDARCRAWGEAAVRLAGAGRGADKGHLEEVLRRRLVELSLGG